MEESQLSNGTVMCIKNAINQENKNAINKLFNLPKVGIIKSLS